MIEALRTARHSNRPLRLSRNEVCELLDLLNGAEEEVREALVEADRAYDDGMDELAPDLAKAEERIKALEAQKEE